MLILGVYSRATTLKLASTGASLSLCDVNASALSGLEAEITDKSSVLFQEVDVSSESDVRSFVRATIEKFGRLDHIFNCAGINPTNIPFEETTLDYWDMQVGVNMKGVFLVTREGLPHMKRGSSIVTVASMSGTRGTAFQSIYRYHSLPCYILRAKVASVSKSNQIFHFLRSKSWVLATSSGCLLPIASGISPAFKAFFILCKYYTDCLI